MEYIEKVEYLRKKLNRHAKRVSDRYSYYDMKYYDHNFSVTIPSRIRHRFKATIGWASKAVDALADRLVFREFKNDKFSINEIFKKNNPDIFFDSVILNALIASCTFVYISKGEDGQPRLQVIEANNATGNIDPITGLLKEGYAVLDRGEKNKPILEAYFDSKQTVFIIDGDTQEERWEVIKHSAGHPLLIPVIHRPDAVRPFGRSRISRAVMYWQKYAKSTLERAEVTSEFYSFPQKYILGMSSEAEQLDTWKATISSMLRIDKDGDGDKPTIGQFQASSMAPFVEQLRTAASGLAGETGLTLDDLGFVSDNPSSAEAIKASHETLRVMAEKAQRSFSSGLLNVGYVACCLRDGRAYKRDEFYNLEVKWDPVFKPDAAALSTIGDGAIKINQAIPGYLDEEVMRDLTGIKGE